MYAAFNLSHQQFQSWRISCGKSIWVCRSRHAKRTRFQNSREEHNLEPNPFCARLSYRCCESNTDCGKQVQLCCFNWPKKNRINCLSKSSTLALPFPSQETTRTISICWWLAQLHYSYIIPSQGLAKEIRFNAYLTCAPSLLISSPYIY